MNGKKGLSRIMSALLAASSMIGGADVSAGSNRKRKVPGVANGVFQELSGGSNRKRKVPGMANGVSQKLSGGSNLYRDLAIGGGSALVGGLLTAAGMHFFGNSKKEKIIEQIVEKVPDLDNDLVTGLVKDIGDFLSVFDNSGIAFDVENVSKSGTTVTLVLKFDPRDDGEIGKFLVGRNGNKVYLGWNEIGNRLSISVSYTAGGDDECNDKVGIVDGNRFLIELDGKGLPKFDKKFIGEGKILRKFLVGLVRVRLLCIYLEKNKGYSDEKIKFDSLAKICRSMWNVRGVKDGGIDSLSWNRYDNVGGFKLED